MTFEISGTSSRRVRSAIASCLTLLIVLFASSAASGQGYIDCATILDDAAFTFPANTKILNGRTYFYSGDSSEDFPVLGTGSPSTGNFSGYLAVFDENCNQIIGTYVSGNSFVEATQLFVAPSGDIYVAGTTRATDFPVTDGNPPIDRSYYVQRYAPDGTLLYSIVQPYPSGFPGVEDLIVDGDQAYVQLSVSSGLEVPTTDGTTSSGNDVNIFSLDGSGNLLFSTLLGGSDLEIVGFNTFTSVIAGGNYWVTGSTRSVDFPTTDGSTNTGGDDVYIAQYDPAGNLLFSTLFGGSDRDRVQSVVADDNFIYIQGFTESSDFPTTNGTTPSGGRDVYVRKYDLNGNLIYSSIHGGTGNDANDATFSDVVVLNGEAYVTFDVADEGGFLTTDGTTGGGTAAFKLDANGNLVYATVLNGEDGTLGVNEAGEAFLFLFSDGSSVTDASTSDGGVEQSTFVKLNADGSVCAVSVVDNDASRTAGGTINETRICNVQGDTLIAVSENFGGALSTDGTSTASGDGYVVTRFVFCPPAPPLPPVAITPAAQEVCQNGLVGQITAPRQAIDGSAFPPIFEDGVERDQPDIALSYQWQISMSPTGPFTDIPGALATLQNYSPPPTAADVYYRRVTKTSDCCGGMEVSISEVAEITVGPNEAPRVELPSLMITCPGETFELTPTVTGGTGPFTYVWSTGETTETINPIVTETSLFGVTVTDANGCIQASQAPLQTYAADAGPDVSICDGTPVVLGGDPLTGVRVVPEGAPVAGDYSVAYTWMPTAGLSCTDCPKPTATPAMEQNYTLTVTIYQPDGTTSCQTTDEVLVALVAPPTTANFAGDDMVICNGETAALGTAPEVDVFDAMSGSTITNGGSTTMLDAATLAELTDGDFFNGVRTDDGTSNNIVIDLGAIQTVNQISLALQNASGFERFDTDMRIEVSTDNVNFTTLFTDVRNSNSAGTPASISALTTLSFAVQDVRYFRFVPESNGRDASLSEFQALLGFTYTWAPGEFLATDGSMATFNPGFVLDDETLLLDVNPRTYVLTAEFDGCLFVDEVQVAMIEARAGEDVKGPAIIGLRDRTPDVDETYTWTRLDAQSTGNSMFLGAMDEPRVPVSASFGGPTSYELATTFTLNGSTAICRDTVVVLEECGCNIVFSADTGCPIDGSIVTASLNSDDGLDPDDFDVSWSPMMGLDVYDQRIVTAQDGIDRTYTVTFTSRIDPTLVCVADVRVNDPAFSVPVFDTPVLVNTCANQPVNIGDPAGNPALEYSWTPDAGLDDPMISNPLATVGNTTVFTGVVVDPSTLCRAEADVTVEVGGFADAGPDVFVCDNGIVMLGTPGMPGFTYSWAPDEGAGGDYRNGTTSSDPQPEVFVAATQQFILTTTETAAGCVKMDTIDVFVNPLPPLITLTNSTFCPSEPGPFTLGFTNLDAAAGTNEVPDAADFGNSFTYEWSPSSALDDPTLRNPTITSPPQVPTTFTLTLDAGGGCTSMGSVTITPTVVQPVTSGNQTICLGEETMIVSPDNMTDAGNITYDWVADGGNPGGATLVTPADPNPTFSSTDPGTFTYTVTRTENGCSTTASVTITVTELVIDPVPSVTLCTGETAQIGNPPVAGLSYEWVPATDLSDPFIANPIFSGTESQTYTLTVVNGAGCTAEETVAVTISPLPFPEIIVEDEVICDPDGRGFMLMSQVIPAGMNYAYSWTPITFITGDPTTPSPMVMLPDVPDEYVFNLEVTDQLSGCQNEASLMVSYRTDDCVFDLALDKALAAGQADPVLPGDDVTFTITVFNQGTIDATNIEVTDYIPTGTTYTATGSTPTGTVTTVLGNTVMLTNNGDGTFLIDGLATGDALAFDLAITTGATVSGSLINNAEITAAEGGIDEDSPLTDIIGSADDDTETGTDGDVADDSTGGTDNPDDQDDYDPATFTVGSPSVAVGDTAFVDLNMDGLQSPGEPGVEGVIVTIIDTNTGDTIMVDAAGNAITGMDTTDAAGFYFFPNLPEGDYTVLFDISEIMDAEFFTFTTPDVGGDDAIDSDAMQLTDTTATSSPTGPLVDGDEDTTLDVGIACNVSITLAPPATLCSTQLIDLTTGITVTPDTSATFGATWSTADGTPGMFLDVNGDPVADSAFGTAVSYQPSDADIQRGSVTLILTTDNPPPTACDAVSEQVTFQILKVDCGNFFWSGAGGGN